MTDCCFFCLCFFEKKLFALWILFTLSSLPGIVKFNILFFNILFDLLELFPIPDLLDWIIFYTHTCCILTFDPGKYAIPKWCTGRKWHIPMASNRKKLRKRDLADEMGQGKKSYWHTHRLIHRKRVTCELHDSYFRLMTIKHAIPKIEWEIEWALNYYITQSWQEVRDELELQLERELWTRCGKESHTRPMGPLGPLMSWGPEKLLIRCSKESHHPTESWAPGPPAEQPWRTRKTQRWRP